MSISLADKVESSLEELIAGADEVQSADIKAKILSILDQTAPKVAQSWRDYEATK